MIYIRTIPVITIHYIMCSESMPLPLPFLVNVLSFSGGRRYPPHSDLCVIISPILPSAVGKHCETLSGIFLLSVLLLLGQGWDFPRLEGIRLEPEAAGIAMQREWPLRKINAEKGRATKGQVWTCLNLWLQSSQPQEFWLLGSLACFGLVCHFHYFLLLFCHLQV